MRIERTARAETYSCRTVACLKVKMDAGWRKGTHQAKAQNTGLASLRTALGDVEIGDVQLRLDNAAQGDGVLGIDRDN